MTIAVIEPAADGLSCVVKAAANLGSVQISQEIDLAIKPVTKKGPADADLGEGIQNLTGVLDLEVIGGAAAAMTIIAGTPREQA